MAYTHFGGISVFKDGIATGKKGTEVNVISVDGELQATAIATGGITTAKIADAAVTLAKVANGTGLSLIGRSANTTGVNADIVGTDGQVARVSGTALGFGTIVAAGIASDAVTTVKILAANVTTAKIADAAVTQAQIKIKAVVALGDAAAALTAAQMVDSGIFTITPTVARILTTDTAANIVAALPGYQVGTWFDIIIVNTAAFDVTLAAGTGITLSGKAIINNVSGTWRARINSATAVTCYRM